ncbi:MAG: hypothetical protein ISN29_07315, partial [Gammaproteobacteria bacterium AqS3]|nr:hypothetical protein [Gammaproteobacteria bacterium AqS3]
VNLYERIEAERSTSHIDITEGSTKTFTYVLKSQPTFDRTIQVSTSHADLTVSTGGDGTAARNLTLTFTRQNWNREQTVTLKMARDEDKADITGQKVSFVRSYGLFPVSGQTSDEISVLMLDDGVNLIVQVVNSNVTEGGSRKFNVNLDYRPQRNRTVNLTSDNDDLTLSPTSLTFNYRNAFSNQEVTITAEDDADTATESATLTLSGEGFVNRTVSFTLVDNDDVALDVSETSLTVDEGGAGGSFTVKLATDPGQNMSVTLSSDNDGVTLSTASLSFTGGSDGNWGTAQSVTVSGIQDADSADESAAISLGGDRITDASVSVTVNDDDDVGLTLSPTSLSVDEGAAGGSFTVKLASDPGEAMSVSLASDNADVTLGAATLSFTGGSDGNWDDAQSVTVSAANDADSADESAAISLTGARIATGSLTVNVNDDDDVGLTLSPTSLTIDEGGAGGSFTVRLASDPGESMSVSLTSDNADVTLGAATLSFTGGSDGSWKTAQSVTVTGVQDSDSADEGATISLSGTRITAASVRVTVNDDEAVGLTLSPTSLSVDEGAAGGSFTVRLATDPGEDMRVSLASDNADVTLGAASLSFTGGSDGNWSAAQSVTVSAANDADTADEGATISLTGARITA